MDSNKIIDYRCFKVSINFLFIHIYADTDAYRIRNKFTHVILSIWYSLIALFLGWWGTSFRYPTKDIENNLKALHINMSGGIKFAEQIESMEYDDFTNHVHRNLKRETYDKLSLYQVSVLLDYHEEYLESDKIEYSQQNIDHIIWHLKKIEVQHISHGDIENIFEAIESYKNYLIDRNFA